MRRRCGSGILLTIWLMATLVLGAMARPAIANASVKEVTSALACQCGTCGLTLETCASGMPECGWAAQARQTISRLTKQGRSNEEIIDYFVSRDGEKVLAAPTRSGFNLTAWLMPFAVIGLGGVGILLALRVWVGRGGSLREAALHKPITAADESYARRIADELSDYEE